MYTQNPLNPQPQCFVYVKTGLSPVRYPSVSSATVEDILAFCFHGQQIHQRPLWACETKRTANFVTCLWKWSSIYHNDSNDNLLILIGGPAISPWRGRTSGGAFAKATVPSLRAAHSWKGGVEVSCSRTARALMPHFQIFPLATGVKSPQMEINVNEANFWQTCSCTNPLSRAELTVMLRLDCWCLLFLSKKQTYRITPSFPKHTASFWYAQQCQLFNENPFY